MMDKCCCRCNVNSKVLVKIYDGDGEPILYEDVDWMHTDDWKTLEIHLKENTLNFTDRENELLRCLLQEAIHNGGYTHLMREYLDLLDKLEKKFE